jgi:hypothetical protein
VMGAAILQHFFQLLYPDVGDGWLILSHPDPTRQTRQGKPALVSDWFDLARTPWPHVAQAAHHLTQPYSVYFGVALQDPDCSPAP